MAVTAATLVAVKPFLERAGTEGGERALAELARLTDRPEQS